MSLINKDGCHNHTISGHTEYEGNNAPLDNRPAFYSAIYIIYIGV